MVPPATYEWGRGYACEARARARRCAGFNWRISRCSSVRRTRRVSRTRARAPAPASMCTGPTATGPCDDRPRGARDSSPSARSLRRGHAGRPLNQSSAGSAVATIGRISSLLYSTSTSMPGTVGSIGTSTISCTDCLSTFSMSSRERNVRVQEVQLDASWLHQSPLHRPSSSKKQLQLSSSIVINVKARAGARLRRSVDPMQQSVCLPYQLMRSAVGVIVVLAQLQNHCRSRETCSFGTPDAVVCRAARSASAALAAVGPSVGIGSASRIGVSPSTC